MTVHKTEHEKDAAPDAQNAGNPSDLPWGADRETHAGPLAGLRVIDAGTMIAGPFASTLLADFGADVIKIEKPGVGDSMRNGRPMKEGRSLWWKVNARNKRLDHARPRAAGEGQRRLPAGWPRHADVLVENFRPGTFERWGLGYDELVEDQPGHRHRARLGLRPDRAVPRRAAATARSPKRSAASRRSPAFADGPPTLPAFPLADSLAGMLRASSAPCARCYERDAAAASGHEIDVSALRAAVRLAESQVIALRPARPRRSSASATGSRRTRRGTPTRPRRPLDRASRPARDRTFERLVQAMGRPELMHATSASLDNASASRTPMSSTRSSASGSASPHGRRRAGDRSRSRSRRRPRLRHRGHLRRPALRRARATSSRYPTPTSARCRMQCVVPRFPAHGCECAMPGGVHRRRTTSVVSPAGARASTSARSSGWHARRSRSDGARRAKPAILGYGSSRYEKRASKGLLEHLWEAIDAALGRAGVDRADVDGLGLCSSASPPGNAVTLAEHFGMELSWAYQGIFGGASGVIMARPRGGRGARGPCADRRRGVAADTFTVASHDEHDRPLHPRDPATTWPARLRRRERDLRARHTQRHMRARTERRASSFGRLARHPAA